MEMLHIDQEALDNSAEYRSPEYSETAIIERMWEPQCNSHKKATIAQLMHNDDYSMLANRVYQRAESKFIEVKYGKAGKGRGRSLEIVLPESNGFVYVYRSNGHRFDVRRLRAQAWAAIFSEV